MNCFDNLLYPSKVNTLFKLQFFSKDSCATGHVAIMIVNLTGCIACGSLPKPKAFRFNSNRHSPHVSETGVVLKTVDNELQPCLYLWRKALRKGMVYCGCKYKNQQHDAL